MPSASFVKLLSGEFESKTHQQLKKGPKYLSRPNLERFDNKEGWNSVPLERKLPLFELLKIHSYKGHTGRIPIFCCRVKDKNSGEIHERYWLDLEQINNLEPRCLFEDYVRSIMLFEPRTYSAMYRNAELHGPGELLSEIVDEDYARKARILAAYKNDKLRQKVRRKKKEDVS